MAVHDIEVDPIRAGGVDGTDLLAETCEVGREDRRGDQNGFAHSGRLRPRRSGVVPVRGSLDHVVGDQELCQCQRVADLPLPLVERADVRT